MILRNNRNFRNGVSTVRKMYEAILVMNSMSDGTLAYPLVSEKGDSNPNGMSFEVRYVYKFLTLSMSDVLLFFFYIYHLLGTFHSLIQEAEQQRQLLTTFQ